MARIAGVNLPKEKQLFIALTSIYGIGVPVARKICVACRIDEHKKVQDLSDNEVNSLVAHVKGLMIEGDLRREVTGNIKRLQEVGSYRGYRHKRNLPVRGQRTKTNARTRRGKRMTIAGKKTESK